MKHIIILLFTVSAVFISCKSNQNQKPTLSKQTQEYLSDYDEFVDTLTTIHPALYEFTSKEEFEKRVKQLRNEINNNTTKRDFIWKLSEVIALVGCGHTSLGFFNQQSELVKLEEYFPIQARLIDEKFYVFDAMINSDKIKNGQEITAINSKSIKKIVNEAYKHISGQGHIRNGKKEMFNVYETTFIPYVLNFPKIYSVNILGQKEPITLTSLNEKPHFRPMINPKSTCQEDFCLNEIDKNTTLLTLRTFAYYGDKTPIFITFLDNSFKKIKDKGYKNLIIDVRGNLGGTNDITIHLLKYTLQEPFQFFADKSDFDRKEIEMPFNNNFKGKIVFLMNGDGFSSVGHLASIYKDRNRVTFIGEDLGSNQFATANQKQFQLTNTKINYTVARNIFFTKVNEQDRSKIIEPDYKVIQSIDDYINNKDTQLEFAIKFLEK